MRGLRAAAWAGVVLTVMVVLRLVGVIVSHGLVLAVALMAGPAAGYALGRQARLRCGWRDRLTRDEVAAAYRRRKGINDRSGQ